MSVSCTSLALPSVTPVSSIWAGSLRSLVKMLPTEQLTNGTAVDPGESLLSTNFLLSQPYENTNSSEKPIVNYNVSYTVSATIADRAAETWRCFASYWIKAKSTL
jgi:hypothetical protein